jgi:hypothetical protein
MKRGSLIMSRVKLVLLGMLAVFAVSAAASASASASQAYWRCANVGATEGRWHDAQCTKKGSPEEFATREITSEEDTFSSKVSILKSATVTITCKVDEGRGKIETGGKSEGEIKFRECSTNLEHCAVVEPIVFKFTDQLLLTSGIEEDEFKATKANETFVEITLEGTSCALKGTHPVKGSQTCPLPNGEEPLIEHEITCTSAGSKLKFGSEAATFESTEHVTLAGANKGKDWGSS